MKALILLLLAVPCSAWTPTPVLKDDVNGIRENFRRSSVDSNRKLDKYSTQDIYGAMNFKNASFSVGTSTLVVTGGKVGIGTTNPTHALDVTGTARITSTLDIGMILRNAGSSCSGVSSCVVTCSAGEKAISGGCYVSGGGAKLIASEFNTAIEIGGAEGWICVSDIAATTIYTSANCARIE